MEDEEQDKTSGNFKNNYYLAITSGELIVGVIEKGRHVVGDLIHAQSANLRSLVATEHIPAAFGTMHSIFNMYLDIKC